MLTRRLKYRLAGRLLKIEMYDLLDTISVCFIAGSIAFSLSDSPGISTSLLVLSILTALLRQSRLLLLTPWVVLGAASEGLLLYGVIGWWLEISFASQVSVSVFLLRLWLRGEHYVSVEARQALDNQNFSE